MATERQVAANRANAKRSTGPKTAAGKLKASRNAFRHGLSTSLPIDPLDPARADAIVEAFLAGSEGADGSAVATEFAQAQLELLRIRSVRTDMLERINTSSADALHRLLSIDRYETRALRRRRRAFPAA
jgi:hypothetical protein